MQHYQGDYYGLLKIVERQKDWEPLVKIPIPLVSVDINASVVHAVAQVEVTQVYVNQEEQPIEAIYYFPVNPDGAVTHFQAELEGRVIKGTVKPHEEAKEAYDKAVNSMQTAFLGEETKTDIFKIRVGFLKPGAQAKIKVGYVTEVKNEPGSNAIRFYIQPSVAPRYVSPSEQDDKAKEIQNMTFCSSTFAPLTLKVVVSIQGKIKSIHCPTHQVKVSKTEPIPENPAWEKATVELSTKTMYMDREFILNILPEEVYKPRLYFEKIENGSTAMMLNLVPSFKLDEQKTELLFVLDRSGSMDGHNIELAKKALLVFLHSMPADCYFNVIGFGSSHDFLFPHSAKYNEETLKHVINYTKKLQANLGGTEILTPLIFIYKEPNPEGYLRQIFILTDGEVSNTDAVLGIVQANAHKARVFALGIGDGASHHLVEGIARAGGGTAAFVDTGYNDSIQKKVLNQLKNALQPSLTDIQLTWEGVNNLESAVNKEKTLLGYNIGYNKPMEVEPSFKQSPKRIPPVYDGSQLLVFGIFKGEVPNAVTIKAQSPDGPLSLTIGVSQDSHVGNTGMLHRLAAVKLVRELELELAALYYQEQFIDLGQEEDRLKKEIREIGCQNGISSKYTSFVAVDLGAKEPSEETWVMETRQVPSQIPRGWHGTVNVRRDGTSVVSFRMSADRSELGESERRSAKPNPMPRSRSRSRSRSRCLVQDDLGTDFSKNAETDSDEDTEDSNIKKLSATPLKVEKLIGLQSFDGSYSLDEKLCLILEKRLENLQQAALEKNLQEWVLATALAT